jgi:hypothetical protein
MTMRPRTTWQNSKTERQAATQRHADIYEMNQDHPQPSATDYENGDPDSWAETPTDNKNVEKEYEGGHVKRNELGFGEFREDTWKHKDSDHWNDGKKYDNAKMAAERKAQAAERVARAILRGGPDDLVEETAIGLMALPAQSLVATLRSMDKVSANALPPDARYRRAFACTKLAARTLGTATDEKLVEHLSRVYMSLDDPTLKEILKTVAAARVAQEQDEDEGSGGQVAQEQLAQQAPVAQQETVSQETVAQETEEVEEEETVSQEEQQAHGLCPEDKVMLDQMLQQEMGEQCPPPAAPPVDDLQALFAPAAPLPGTAMPAMASDSPDISFDDDSDEEVRTASTASAPAGTLDVLFQDDPEVQAQRALVAAQQDRKAEGGYGGRIASSRGVKKLGAVQAPKGRTQDQALESLWDRPE